MDYKHNETILKDYLNYLIYKKIITKYYLQRIGVEKWELQINHNIISELNTMCILFELDLYCFNLEQIKIKIKELLTLNFQQYLNKNM